MQVLPCFLDCEASSFAAESYPIAVAWSDPFGLINRCLINTAMIREWTDWDPSAEAVHGIERERLRRNGWAPDFVVERLGTDLRGKQVYTDAPDFDGHWLLRLFMTVQGTPPPFTLAHIDDLLIPLVQREGELIYQGLLRLEALKSQIRQTMTGAHDAGYDVGYLLQLFRAAQGKPVKMNHGIGPLPVTSATGTFVRVKTPIR